MKSSAFIAGSAAVILLLGLLHLLYTFRGHKLHPRDPDLTARMMAVSPVITRETTMWRAWVGFNATHSFGLRARKLIIVTNEEHCVILSAWALQKNSSRNTAYCFRI
jgi:hypothetical protein